MTRDELRAALRAVPPEGDRALDAEIAVHRGMPLSWAGQDVREWRPEPAAPGLVSGLDAGGRRLVAVTAPGYTFSADVGLLIVRSEAPVVLSLQPDGRAMHRSVLYSNLACALLAAWLTGERP